MTPTGGSHGKPHRTTKILSHARRRDRVAARGAGAARRKNAPHRLATLVDEAKQTGVVQKAIDAKGLKGVNVATK